MSPFRQKRKRWAKARPVRGTMNKNEEQYASELEAMRLSGDILAWWYEGITLNLAPKTTLTLDFVVVEKDGTLMFVECKAGLKNGKCFKTEDSWVKTKLAAEKFPHLKIVMTWTHKLYGRKHAEVGSYGMDDNNTAEAA